MSKVLFFSTTRYYRNDEHQMKGALRSYFNDSISFRSTRVALTLRVASTAISWSFTQANFDCKKWFLLNSRNFLHAHGHVQHPVPAVEKQLADKLTNLQAFQHHVSQASTWISEADTAINDVYSFTQLRNERWNRTCYIFDVNYVMFCIVNGSPLGNFIGRCCWFFSQTFAGDSFVSKRFTGLTLKKIPR